MLRILLFTLFITIGTGLSAQHFDPMFSENSTRTWRDSGYYFVPELVRFIVIGYNPNGFYDEVTIHFQSTDNSGLSYYGTAVLFVREDDIPPEIDIEVGSKGFSTILLPQDLLFCPDEEDEQGMGQDDPYFPLSLVGRIERVDGVVPDSPIQTPVQLNDFTVQ